MNEYIIILDYGTKHPHVVNDVFTSRDDVVAYIDRYLSKRPYRVFKLTQSGCVLRSEDDALDAFKASALR